MDQGIRFVITGDTEGLKKSVNSAENELSAMSKKVYALQKDIADNVRITLNYEKAIEDLSAEFRAGKISQDQYAKSLARLQRDEQETIIETERLRKELVRLKKDQKALQAANGRLGGSIKGVGTSSVNALPAVTEFSRIIQDAPFGIMGVGNNIQQLTGQFGYLSKAAGGALPALKAMLGALAGPAGILLAVSSVTTLLTVFQDELFKTANKAEKLQEELDGITDLFDSELAINDEIQKSLELQGKSTAGILAERKKILQNQLDSLGVLIEQQQELLNIQIAENQSISNWEALTSWINQALNTAVGIAKAIAIINFESLKSTKLFNSILAPIQLGLDKLKESSKATGASAEDLAKQRELQTKLNELIARQLSLKNQILEADKEINELYGNRTIQAQLELDTAPVFEDFIRGGIEGNLDGLFKVPSQETEAFVNRLKQAQEQAGIINKGIGASFNALSSEMANALSTGNSVLDAFVGSLIQSLGQMLSALAQSAIQQIAINQATATSSAIAGGAASGAATGPGAIFTTPAFIAALVGVVGAAFASLGSFAQGGIIGGGKSVGDNVLIRANSGEMILTTQDQSMLTRFLRGETISTQNQTGGLPNLEASTVLRGSDIYLSWSRSEKNNKRFFGR